MSLQQINRGLMALNIKNDEVTRLTEELSKLTGESKTEVIRKALIERKKSLNLQMFFVDKKKRLINFFEQEIWPQIPKQLKGVNSRVNPTVFELQYKKPRLDRGFSFYTLYLSYLNVSSYQNVFPFATGCKVSAP